METVPFSSQNVALPLALSSLKGEELPRKNDSYGSQRIYYTSGFHSFLPSQRKQMHRKGAQQACYIMQSFPLKQRVLFRKLQPPTCLNHTVLLSDSVPFPVKACRFISQIAWLFILKPAILLSKKAWFLY